jgi:hypothetical protein
MEPEMRATARFEGMKMRFVFAAVAVAGLVAPPHSEAQAITKDREPLVGPAVTVYKDPNCGCCKEWIEHLRKHAFKVVAKDTSDLSGIKRSGRVPSQLMSCHTAFVSGYVIEGHVPAEDIQRLLKEKPKVAGLAVAGMPVGSPGMEMGNRKDKYDVVAFNRDGSTQVFAKH